MQNSTVEGFRLSPQQRALWSLQQTAEEQPFRALAAILIEGDLQSHVLQNAVQYVVDRHEILRTTFSRPPGIKTMFQVVGETSHFSGETADLSSLDVTEQELRIAEYFAREIERPFDFEKGPLLRVTLIKQTDNRHVLLISLPALCADSVTLTNFIHELSKEYAARLNQQVLSGEPMQYADFAEWQNELLEDAEEHAAADKNYWRNSEAAQALPPAILGGMRNAETTSFEPDFIPFDLDSTLQNVEGIADKYETSVTAVLFAAWHSLLWRLAGQSESAFLLHSLFTGRKFGDLKSALGLYAKYLPIILNCEDRPFVEHLRRIGNVINEADEWQEYFDSGASAKAVADSVAFEVEERQSRYTAGPLSFSEIKRYVCFNPFNLKLSCLISGSSISAELHYNAQFIHRDAVKQIASYFQRFLSGLLQNPEADISGIEILSDDERRRLLVEFNQTSGDLRAEECIHQLFEEQVAKTPHAIAVVSGDQELTYGELNKRANQLAHLLRDRAVGPDACVGLCVERSVEMIVGLIGILKAGGAYVPLNPDHPRDRLALQLAESNASILIAGKNDVTTQPFESVETIDLDRNRALLEAQPDTNPSSNTGPDNLVYVIYTSGSTGTPKGVAVRHCNLTNYTQFILQRLQIDGPLNFATVSTISADLGNTCIFPALVSGGCLHIIGYDVAMEGDLLRDYFIRQPIDVLKIVPSHFSALLASQADSRLLPAKYLILGGEALSWDLVEQVRLMEHTCQIINHYGPTETTVGSLTFHVDLESPSRFSATVPIGRPIANTQCYILDQRLRPVPSGVNGELYIGGAGVSAGYLNQPAETAARFVKDPFYGDPESRLYRTGDLARYLPDGNIEFLGRADTQVKVRGYRVELGEIEAVLCKRAGVRQVVVTVFRDKSAGERVVAYMVSSPVSPEELRVSLKEKLPDYMVPSAFVFLKSLPLTPNGKVDRNALPAPDETRPGLQSDYVAPRSVVEKELAGIWAGFLKVSAVGVHDNFFDLGGHSLLATQVVSRMRKEFQVEIPLRALFELPTVAQLAKKIEEANSNEAERLLNEIEALSEEDARQLLGQEGTTAG
jgi:amino acid adenylation domain-containing protein